jgi:hypothetical protein
VSVITPHILLRTISKRTPVSTKRTNMGKESKKRCRKLTIFKTTRYEDPNSEFRKEMNANKKAQDLDLSKV